MLHSALVRISKDALRVRWSCKRTLSVVQDSAEKETSTKEEKDDVYQKILVIGGNGFVGSEVCKEARSRGMNVCSISRSGKPPRGSGSWTKDVEWIAGDALHPNQWLSHLSEANGVVSTVGAFGTNAFMEKICGDANVESIRAASKAKVKRFAFISAHDYGLPEFVLRGYFKGKRKAEKVLFEEFPATGVALRPGFIYGKRQVGPLQVPLGMIGIPLESMLRRLPSDSKLKYLPLASAVLVPPTSVTDVARAAVSAATNSKVPSGIMDVYQIVEYAKM